MWAVAWSIFVGIIRGIFGLKAPAAAPTAPTVNNILQGTADHEQAVEQETQKVVLVGNATELNAARVPDSVRAPDPFSRD